VAVGSTLSVLVFEVVFVEKRLTLYVTALPVFFNTSGIGSTFCAGFGGFVLIFLFN
jgi:hypothetical protein